MNIRRKQQKALTSRIAGYEETTRDPKLKNSTRKPGSQNRKKGLHGNG